MQANSELWKELYETFLKVRDLAPWSWMEESDLFGVQLPGMAEPGFISIMGMAGEHFAIAIYMGFEGLFGFNAMQQAAPFVDPEMLLQIPQLQASLEDRDQLSQKDRDQIKQLGLKFRGKNAWPMFRSYRPGYLPWPPEESEIRWLLVALQQVLDVAPRFKENRKLFSKVKKTQLFLRKPAGADDKVAWEDSVVTIKQPEPKPVEVLLDNNLLNRLQKARRAANVIEVDMTMMLSAVTEKDVDRPFFPYMVLVVDARSGMILGMEMERAHPSLEAMWGRVPNLVVASLAKMGGVPAEIHVQQPLLADLLSGIAATLNIKIKQVRALKGVAAFQQSLQNFGGLF